MRIFLGAWVFTLNIAFAGIGVVDKNYLWPDGKVPYAIDESCPNPALFRQALKMWEEKTALEGKKVIEFVPSEGTNFFDSIICTALTSKRISMKWDILWDLPMKRSDQIETNICI